MTGKDFAPRLELALKALSISRGRLAVELQLHKSVVGRWLNGATIPSGHNLTNLTALVASRRDGFTMLDWESDLPQLAARLGVADAPALAVSATPAGLDWLPPRVAQEVLATTGLRGEAFEGFWRSTRPSNEYPGRFAHDRIMIRRNAAGLLSFRMAVIDMRFVGLALPVQTQLFAFGADANTGVFIFTIFNAVLRQRADVMDGITLTCTQDGGGSPVSACALMERTGLLSGDTDADDARFEASVDANPLAPEGSISDEVRAHLLRDVGPTALAMGGEAMLTMAFVRSMSRGPKTGVPLAE